MTDPPDAAGSGCAYRAPGPTWDAAPVTRRVLALCRTYGARRVLDVGCGNGAFARELVDAGFDVAGCDASESGIRVARAAVPAARFERRSLYEPPGDLGGPFDVVTAIEVIEHLDRPKALPRFAAAVLRPGGRLIVSTPYHGYLKNLAIGLLGRWDRHFSPAWDGGHVKFFSRRTLAALMEAEGFRPVAFQGAGRVPGLWKSMVAAFQAPDAGSG